MSLKAKLKQFVRLGQRGAYGQSILHLAARNENLFCLSADLGNSSGLDRFKSKYSSRYLNIGIAEQHLIGFSSGLSTLGFNCFVSSFAPFVTMRCCEQIRMNLGYMQENVKIVGLGSGISMGFLGNSHFGLEDISVMSCQNNIPVLCPSDTTQLYFILSSMVSYEGPMYLRLTGTAATSKAIYDFDHYESVEEISIGGSSTLKEGTKLLMLSHGEITSECIDALGLLGKDLQDACHHEDVYCVYPLGDKVRGLIESYDLIMIVEEHRRSGGLYTQVCEAIANKERAKNVEVCSLPNEFLSSGDYDTLKKQYGLDARTIASRLKLMLS